MVQGVAHLKGCRDWTNPIIATNVCTCEHAFLLAYHEKNLLREAAVNNSDVTAANILNL